MENHLNWGEKIKKRYHKYVRSLSESEYNLKIVSEKFGFQEKDVLSICMRIERELKEHFDIPEQKSTKKEKVQVEKKTEKKPTMTKRQKFILIIKRSLILTEEEIDETFPRDLALIVKALRVTKNITKTSEMLKMQKSQVLERLLSEKGALYYLKKKKTSI